MPIYTIKTPRGDEVDIDAADEATAITGAQRWDHEDYARTEATKAGLSPDLVVRQMAKESGGDPSAVSPKGARGPMQLMPGTAQELGVDPDDPYQNIAGGVRYLKEMHDRFGGDERLALAAYNAGPGAVDRAGGVPDFAETQDYVRSLAGQSPPRLAAGSAPTAPTTAPRIQQPMVAPKVDQGLGFAKGVTDPIDHASNWLEGAIRGSGAEAPLTQMGAALRGAIPRKAVDFIDNPTAYFDAQKAQGRIPGKIGQFAGNVASTMWAPGGPLASGAITGALLSEGGSPAEVVRDAAYGAAGGKIGSSVVGGLGKALTGVTGDALTLAQKGIPLTVGRILGDRASKIEDSLTSAPLIGDFVRNAQRRSLEGANRAAFEDTLAHIGETLPKEINVGRDAYNYTKQTLSDAYDDVLSPLLLTKDAPWTAALGATKASLAKIGNPSVRKEALDTIKTEVLARFDKAGKMTGEEMKAAQEALTGHINDLSRGTKWQRDTAGILKGLKGDLEGLVGRVDPAAGQRLAKVNKAYSFLKPLEDAAAKPSSKDGIFTIPRLAMGAAKGKSKATLAGGKAPHQTLADAARILPSSVPDSGSAPRIFTGAGLTGLLGAFGGNLPVIGPAALPAAGLFGGAASLYTRGGQKLLTDLASRRPQVARVAGKNVQRLAAPAGKLGAVGVTTVSRQ